MLDKMLTVPEVAEALGKSNNWTYSKVREIGFVRIGKSWRCSEQDVRDYLQRCFDAEHDAS